MGEKIILLAGGSGFLGREIGNFLESKDYTVRVLTRAFNKKLNFEQFIWDPATNYIDPAAFEAVYGVINLAGASLAGKRWTDAYKLELIKSRVSTTSILVKAIHSLISKPKIFIQHVGIGIYGHRPNETLTEDSATAQQGFIPSLCHEWEQASQGLSPEVRSVVVRTGIVLNLKGGYLAKTKLPSMFGFSPLFGSGNQIYSWIHISDLKQAIAYLIDNQGLEGILNLTAPNPVSQSTIARSMTKKFIGFAIPIPIPIIFLKILVGEMANTLIESQEVLPKKLMDHGFIFKYPDINGALDDLIKNKNNK